MTDYSKLTRESSSLHTERFYLSDTAIQNRRYIGLCHASINCSTAMESSILMLPIRINITIIFNNLMQILQLLKIVERFFEFSHLCRVNVNRIACVVQLRLINVWATIVACHS